MEPVSLDALRKVDIHACSVCMTMHSSQQFVINDYMVLNQRKESFLNPAEPMHIISENIMNC